MEHESCVQACLVHRRPQVYHRQIYKNFLTNKVLRDPRQRRFFTARDMSDLFQLAEPHARGGGGGGGVTETQRIFRSIDTEVRLDEAGAPQGGGGGEGIQGGGGDGGTEGENGRDGGADSGDAEPGPSSSRGAAAATAAGGGGKRGAKRRRGNAAAAGAAGAGSAAAAAGGASGGGGAADDASILRDLFEGSGLKSLLDHDKIESANDPEVLVVDVEASRIARNAAEALRRSRAACQVRGRVLHVAERMIRTA